MRHNNHAQRRANCLSPCPRLPSRVVIHRLACSSGHPRSLLEYRLLGPVHKVSDSGVGPIICISKQFPDDVDDTSLGTILWELLPSMLTDRHEKICTGLCRCISVPFSRIWVSANSVWDPVGRQKQILACTLRKLVVQWKEGSAS